MLFVCFVPEAFGAGGADLREEGFGVGEFGAVGVEFDGGADEGLVVSDGINCGWWMFRQHSTEDRI
jgi:hypothetical protein